jgi:hypothetical protein
MAFDNLQLETEDCVMTIDPQVMKAQIASIESKRTFLVKLLEQPNLGTLRIDVNQALEEIDDLLEDFRRTFPDDSSHN